MRPRGKRHRSVHRAALGEEENAVLQGIIRVLVKDAEAWMRQAKESAQVSTKKSLVKNVIAPDGYVPNSMIRRDVRVFQYGAFIEVKKGLMVAKADLSTLEPFQICMDRAKSIQKGSQQIRKEQLETIRAEAARFKLSAVYNESKKILRLLEQSSEQPETESHLLRLRRRMTRKLALYRMRRKLLTMRMRKELMAYAKQRVIETRQSMTYTDQHKNRRLLRPSLSVRTLRKLSKDEFQAMRDKLIGTLESQDNAYSLIESALKDPPDEVAVQRLASILGSQAHLHQYLATFKQPKYLLPYLIFLLGGRDRVFHILDKALMGDLWSIYRIARCIGFDLKATVRLLTSVELTVAAAVSCLVIKPCHFHYVEDFINALLKNEWSDTDLVELANGRYVQNLKPGERPNRNPLFTVATRMSEHAFLEFYKALHELNHRYFKSLGSVQYEQLLIKTTKTVSESQSQYAEVLRCMEDGKNYSILRPSHATYRKLATQMLEISTGGGLPPFLTDYFAQLVENHLTIACSEVLREVCCGSSAIESLSLDMNLFFEVFMNACCHVKRIIRGRLSGDEVTRILVSIVKGDGDEVYRLEGLLEPNLARFLINVLRTLHGKVVRGILIYTLVSSSSEALDSLLQKSLGLNEQSPVKSLIEAWITLTDLSFLLSEDLHVDENIDSMLNVLRQTKFFLEAGCKGVITIPPAPSHFNRQKRLGRSTHIPIKARTSSISVSSKSSAKSVLTKDQRRLPGLSRNLSTRDYRFMLTRASRLPTAHSDSEESLQQDFLDRESEFFSAQRGAMKMDLKSDSESDIGSDDSFVFSSIIGAFNRGKSKVNETESQIEMLTRQIKIANREVPKQNFIEPEQMDLVEDSWRALVELQGIQKVIGSKDWDDKVVTTLSKDLYCALMKLTSWLGVMLGDQKVESVGKSFDETLHGEIRDGVDLTKTLWQELSTLKSSGVVSSVEETYVKFREYLSYLRAELSDEVQFLNEVDAEALHYGMNDLSLLETGGLEHEQNARTNQPASKKNVHHQIWTNKQSAADQTLRKTFAALIPVTHSSDESSGKPKKPAHIVPSLQTMLSKKEILILPPTQPEQTATPSPKPEKPSSGKKKNERLISKDLSVQGKAYHVQALPEPSIPDISKKSVTLDPSISLASSTQKADNVMEDQKVEKHVDGIFKGAFLPKRKSVHYVLYEAKKDELAKYLQTRHDYNKESSEKIANHLFKAGITGISHNRLSHLLTKLLQEKTAGKSTVGSDEISDSIHRNLTQRMDELIDWVELLDSLPDISAGSEVTTSPSSEMSPKSHTTVWSASTSAEHKTKSTLPPIRPELKPSVESIKSRVSTRILKRAKKTPSTPTSMSSSELTTSELSGRNSPILDAVARTDSSESIPCEVRPPAIFGPRLGDSSASKTITSPYGTWAFSVSTETPSSEFTDRVLTDTNADLEPRRPFKVRPNDGVAIVSPFEVAEHIANVLEAIMDAREESNALIRGTLNVLAECPPDLDYLEKLINKYHEEKSIFWNDSDEGTKLMNVFKDVIFDTALMMLRHLEPEKADSLLSQTKDVASVMFSKLSQVGTVILSKSDVQRLFDGISVLNSNSFLEGDLFKHKGTSSASLPDNAQRWFKPLDLNRIFKASFTVKAKPDSSRDGGTRLPEIKLFAQKKAPIKGEDVSTILLTDTALMSLPPKLVEAAQRVPMERRFTLTLNALDVRLQHRLRAVMRDPSMKNQRDITQLMSTMLQQSERVRFRVNRRLNALGLLENPGGQNLSKDISNFVRVVNRPSFIKPHEWARLTGRTGLASFRFGNSTLCHRGERGALGSLIRADATAELSHKMVVNFDLAHVFNRYSLFQLTELFGGT